MATNYPIIRECEEFHGFRTVHFYEIECAKAGQRTERIPCFSADGAEVFALLTHCPEPCSDTAFDGLDVITTNEAHCLYSGAVRHDGSDLESVLSAAGFRLSSKPLLVDSQPDPKPEPIADVQNDFVQLSFAVWGFQ